MIPNPFRRQSAPTQPTRMPANKDDCEIIIEKTAKGVRRRIRGSCSPAQLRALSGQTDDSVVIED